MTSRQQIVRLLWDDWNRNHIVKHGVTPEEAEEVVAGTVVARESYKNRLQLIGSTQAGRMLTVVVGPVPGQRASITSLARDRQVGKNGGTSRNKRVNWIERPAKTND